MNGFAVRAFNFSTNLNPDFILPENFQLLLPYENPTILELTKLFFTKFYSGNTIRNLILGINPGRFGGGTTGISFTDPVRLETDCGIENPLPKRAELSSIFIYEMINAYGGAETFYKKNFLSSICPVGFIKNGKNINYYDDKILLKSSSAWIKEMLLKQVSLGVSTKKVFCLGEGANFKYLQSINIEVKLFEEIIPLAHPRFIMQYKRKHLEKYINQYVEALQ